MPALTLRLDAELHRVAAIAAAARGVSLTKWLTDAARAQALRDALRNPVVAAAIERTEKEPTPKG